LPNATAYEEILSVPIFPGMDEEDVDDAIEAL
jgi:dTDP-4-amino-4,6-dideoxygalactose transaminase